MQYLSALLALSSEQKQITALDFGCGLGITARLLHTCKIETVGYDPSPSRSRSAEESGYTLVRSEKDLISRGPFDLIICDNVLEHVPLPSETIRLFSSLSSEGSLLYISVPDFEEEILNREINIAKRGLPISMSFNPWEHLNYFDSKSLDRLVESSGFKRIPATLLPGPLDIGLRPERGSMARFKNGLASLGRLIRYAITGKGSVSVCSAFYRFSGRQA
jgi:SAM-dependent methyltransferase